MTRFVAAFAAIVVAFGVAASPTLIQAAGTESPPTPPPADSGKSKSKEEKKSFLDGYRRAYAAIYQRHDYASAIGQLKALRRDSHPDVANLIGYAHRKLGQYDESRSWYEAALRSDPTHVRTWQYYGLWHLEQGNEKQAKVHLDRIAMICGASCAEYRMLSEAMGTVAAGGRPVY